MTLICNDDFGGGWQSINPLILKPIHIDFNVTSCGFSVDLLVTFWCYFGHTCQKVNGLGFALG